RQAFPALARPFGRAVAAGALIQPAGQRDPAFRVAVLGAFGVGAEHGRAGIRLGHQAVTAVGGPAHNTAMDSRPAASLTLAATRRPARALRKPGTARARPVIAQGPPGWPGSAGT